jgi:hypothetical protein
MHVSPTSTDALWQTDIDAKRAEIEARRRLNAASREYSRFFSEARDLEAAHDLAIAGRRAAAAASYLAEADWEAAYKACAASAACFAAPDSAASSLVAPSLAAVMAEAVDAFGEDVVLTALAAAAEARRPHFDLTTPIAAE